MSLRSCGLQPPNITPPSRDTLRPSFANSFALKKQRAQGRPGARCTRGPVCKSSKQKRTRAYRFSGNTPAFPAQWFYGLYRALPGETWLACHRRQRDAKHHRQLDTCHRGVRTTRLCRPRHALFVKSASASTAPRSPTFVTIAKRPSWWARDGEE